MVRGGVLGWLSLSGGISAVHGPFREILAPKCWELKGLSEDPRSVAPALLQPELHVLK